MALTFRKLHPCFAAEVSPVDLKTVHDEATLGRIRAGMDEFAVLVFRDQIWSDAVLVNPKSSPLARRATRSRFSRAPLKEKRLERPFRCGCAMKICGRKLIRKWRRNFAPLMRTIPT